jgi:L-fucose dehydrogenase
MDLQLKDRVVIVTGGAQGKGAAHVLACAGEGAVPMIVDRDAKAGGQLRNELSSKSMTCGLVTAELSTPEDCSRAVDETLKTLGRLDALVNAISCITTAWPITLCRT